MLPRAALRALRSYSHSSPLRQASPAIPSSVLHLRPYSSTPPPPPSLRAIPSTALHLRPAIARTSLHIAAIPSTSLHIRPATRSTPLHIRSYSSKPPHPPPPPPPASAKPPRRPPPPPQAFQSVTKSARQTSPGTSFPKDQTWKAQDGIKFGGPAAATVSGAGSGEPDSVEVKSRAAPVDSDSDSSRPAGPGPVRGAAGILEDDITQQQPLAHKINIDEPPAGGVRRAAQEIQAEAENMANSASQARARQMEEPHAKTPQAPLPDLRQGIPSTFDIEFGQARQGAARKSTTIPRDQQETLDVTYQQSEGQQQRDRGERDYDRSAYETSLDRRRAQFLNYLYLSILSLALTGALYLSRPYSSADPIPSHLNPNDASGWSPMKLYARMRARIGSELGYYTEPTFPKLLPEMPENQRLPFTLVLSLEDLMIHSTWDREHGYRTAKRPGIDYFIRYLSQYYELVLFTSVPIGMADPVIKKLDPFHFIMWPLGREATKYDGGEYVKDLAYLNRPLSKTLIIDTHAPHVKNQPENAIILPKWTGNPKDPHTKDLVALIPFLEYVATMGIDDVRPVIKSFQGTHIPEEFARREALAREKFQHQLAAEKSKRPRHSLGSLASGLGIGGPGARPGGMILADGQSVADGLAQGKMLSDQIREQGQRQYEYLEKQIREHGAQWLKEEEEEQKKMMDAQMKEMKGKTFSWFGVFGGGGGRSGVEEKK